MNLLTIGMVYETAPGESLGALVSKCEYVRAKGEKVARKTYASGSGSTVVTVDRRSDTRVYVQITGEAGFDPFDAVSEVDTDFTNAGLCE